MKEKLGMSQWRPLEWVVAAVVALAVAVTIADSAAEAESGAAVASAERTEPAHVS